jgi:type I restriction enzyme S subunit
VIEAPSARITRRCPPNSSADPVTPFPKYERYKDSGVEWLGEVPEHWEVEKGLRYFVETEERSQKGDEELLSVSHLTGVTPRSEKNITMFMAESYEGSKLCEVGDIAVNTMWAWMAALGVSKHRGLVSPSYGTYRQRKPERFNSTYLDHLIRTDVYRSHYTVNSTGITTSRLRLYPHSFLRLKFVCPPREEQDRIVAFLDRKTAVIDALIAKKQRQIELLDEQKAILIHRAVTRGLSGIASATTGLNPNAKLKPSGIEWIGEIPEHWETRQVRHLFDNLDNRRIPISSIDRGKMTERLYDYYGASGAIDKVDGYIFEEDLILIAEDGANLVMRNLPLAIHATGKYWVNNHAHILRPREGPIDYWLHALECCDFTTSITGSAQPKLTKDALASCFLPCPPVHEQRAIVAFLNQNREAEEKLRTTITAQIESLQTFRSTLIAHAVTGRFKV